MSLPDRNNPYHFNDYLQWRQSVDYYRDDPFIQKVVRQFTGDIWPQADAEARACSQKASYRWRDISDCIARPEKGPLCCTTTVITTALTALCARRKRKSWKGRFFRKRSLPKNAAVGEID